MELAAADDAPPVAVANYGALPTDVLHDILLRLPADEVCRLRLVCRSWRSLTSDPLFAAAHAARHPHVIVSHYIGHGEVEVDAVDLQGNVIKRRRIRRPDATIGCLSVHGDLLCASYGWGLAYVVDMVTGAVVADVTAEHRSKVNAVRPQCVLGHVPSTGEYKVLRIQDEGYSSRRPLQTCEVVTVSGGGGSGGGGAGAGRWRRRPRPPVNVSITPGSGNMAVVAGLAYFLVCPGQPHVETAADSIAVFDLAMEEWKPATLQGPLSSSSLLLARGRRSADDDEEPVPVLRRKRFQLATTGESLVMVYCNVERCSTELWFLLEDDDTAAAARWSRRYTLQRTPFEELPFSSLQYRYPLAVLVVCSVQVHQ